MVVEVRLNSFWPSTATRHRVKATRVHCAGKFMRAGHPPLSLFSESVYVGNKQRSWEAAAAASSNPGPNLQLRSTGAARRILH